MHLKFGDICSARNLKHLPVASVLLKVLKENRVLSLCTPKILVLYAQRKSEIVCVFHENLES